jgi:hypothetical protein
MCGDSARRGEKDLAKTFHVQYNHMIHGSTVYKVKRPNFAQDRIGDPSWMNAASASSEVLSNDDPPYVTGYAVRPVR